MILERSSRSSNSFHSRRDASRFMRSKFKLVNLKHSTFSTKRALKWSKINQSALYSVKWDSYSFQYGRQPRNCEWDRQPCRPDDVRELSWLRTRYEFLRYLGKRYTFLKKDPFNFPFLSFFKIHIFQQKVANKRIQNSKMDDECMKIVKYNVHIDLSRHQKGVLSKEEVDS